MGFVTFVDEARVREKRDPGHVYVIAGFRYVLNADGTRCRTKGGHGRRPLLVLRLDEAHAPEPRAARFGLVTRRGE